MTMNADKRDSHRVSFRFWAQTQPKNAAGILHNRRACSALQGIGGRVTNKQSAKSPTIALLATIENGKTFPSLPNSAGNSSSGLSFTRSSLKNNSDARARSDRLISSALFFSICSPASAGRLIPAPSFFSTPYRQHYTVYGGVFLDYPCHLSYSVSPAESTLGFDTSHTSRNLIKK